MCTEIFQINGCQEHLEVIVNTAFGPEGDGLTIVQGDIRKFCALSSCKACAHHFQRVFEVSGEQLREADAKESARNLYLQSWLRRIRGLQSLAGIAGRSLTVQEEKIQASVQLFQYEDILDVWKKEYSSADEVLRFHASRDGIEGDDVHIEQFERRLQVCDERVRYLQQIIPALKDLVDADASTITESSTKAAVIEHMSTNTPKRMQKRSLSLSIAPEKAIASSNVQTSRRFEDQEAQNHPVAV